MNSNTVLWVFLLMLIVFVIRFRLTARPIRGSKVKPLTVNSESLKYLQQYWSSQLPLGARRMADIESRWLQDLTPKNPQYNDLVKKCLSNNVQENFQELRSLVESGVFEKELSEKDLGEIEYILHLIYKGLFSDDMRNEEEATKWLSQAAEHGHVTAMLDLGMEEIIETMRDENSDVWPVARAYFTRAAEKKMPEACFMLANVSMVNNDMNYSREEVLELMRQAAVLKHPVANFILALAHLIDDRKLLDKSKSKHYFETLNELAYPSGQAYYAELILGSDVFELDNDLAFQLLEDASAGGYTSACIPLGKMYELEHVPSCKRLNLDRQQMQAKALSLYRAAAVQGNFQALLNMLRLYKTGVNCPDYDEELNYWFEFETSKTSKSHIAMHMYLAWLYIFQQQNQVACQESLDTVETILEKLHLPFEEFNFDQAFQAIKASSIEKHYAGFLRWLLSDYCETVYRNEQTHLLANAAKNGLRIAQLVICDPNAALSLDFESPDKISVMQVQAKKGCGAACFKMFEYFVDDEHEDITLALDWLEQGVAQRNVESLMRYAYFKLEHFDLNENDEKLRTYVVPDLNAIEYLKQAASARSQQAAKLLEQIYLRKSSGPDIDKVKYYHRYGLINFGEEEQYIQSFIKSLVRIELDENVIQSASNG